MDVRAMDLRPARAVSLPHVRQELVELRDRRGGDPGQDAGEVTLRIDPMALGTGDEAVERGGTLGGDIMPGEEPVLTFMGSSA
jgi:hypothetical protein